MASRPEMSISFRSFFHSSEQVFQQMSPRSFSGPPFRTCPRLGKSIPARPAERLSQSSRSARRASCSATSRKEGMCLAASFSSLRIRSAQSVSRRDQSSAHRRIFPRRMAA